MQGRWVGHPTVGGGQMQLEAGATGQARAAGQAGGCRGEAGPTVHGGSPHRTAVGISRMAGMAARQAPTPNDCSSPEYRCSTTVTVTTPVSLSASSSTAAAPPAGLPAGPALAAKAPCDGGPASPAARAATAAARLALLLLAAAGGSRACREGEAWRLCGLLSSTLVLLPTDPGGVPAAASGERTAPALPLASTAAAAAGNS